MLSIHHFHEFVISILYFKKRNCLLVGMKLLWCMSSNIIWSVGRLLFKSDSYSFVRICTYTCTSIRELTRISQWILSLLSINYDSYRMTFLWIVMPIQNWNLIETNQQKFKIFFTKKKSERFYPKLKSKINEFGIWWCFLSKIYVG